MDNHKKLIVDIAVRFKDIDAMGHVNNAVFFTYFEEGRKAFFSRVLGVVRPEDYTFILANISCDYLKPIKISDSVFLHMWLSDMRRKTFRLKYRLVDANDESAVYAKGESLQVYFDYATSSTMPIPESFAEEVSEYVEPAK